LQAQSALFQAENATQVRAPGLEFVFEAASIRPIAQAAGS
jgi:hypothetical protein